MNSELRLKILENAYIGALVDSVYNYGKNGVLDEITKDKKKMQMLIGKKQAEQFGITNPEDVFKTLSQVFNCTPWEIEEDDKGFEAKATSCKLCAFAKKMGAESPCDIYCLNPMEGMIKGVNTDLEYEVLETLWNGNKCLVKVINDK